MKKIASAVLALSLMFAATSTAFASKKGGGGSHKSGGSHRSGGHKKH